MGNSVKIIQPSGIIDGSRAKEFRQQITDTFSDASVILIDFSNVTFMDSSGLGALVLAHQTMSASNRQLYVCSLNDEIRMLFELTSIDQKFQIFSSKNHFEQEFLAN